MSNTEFAVFLGDNYGIYLILMPIFVILYLIILKKYYSGIWDPMFLCAIISGLAITPLFYLKYFNFIDNSIFYYCIIAEICFWYGFISTFDLKHNDRNERIENNNRFYYKLFVVFAIIVLIEKMLFFSLYGIPVLHYNRYEIAPSGGFMMLEKVSGILNFYCVIYSFCRIRKSLNIFSIYLFFYVIVAFLGGGKSFILGLIGMFFVYKTFIKGELIKNSWHTIAMIAFVLITPVLIILVNTEDSIEATTKYIFRIVAYGDIYWNAFPYKQVEHIHISSPLLHFFSQILGPLRLIDYNIHGEPVGRLLYWEINDISYLGEAGGANARPIVLGYVFYRFGGIVFCFICGCIMALLMSYSKFYFRKNFLGAVIAGYIYISSISFATDPVMAWGWVIPLAVFIALVKFLINLLGYRKIKIIRLDMIWLNNMTHSKMNRIFLIATILTCVIAFCESL